MSDDLVKRWDDYVESMGCVMGEVEHTAQQMRDRIEELELAVRYEADLAQMALDARKELEDALSLRTSLHQECIHLLQSAEAKLSKSEALILAQAVEGLEFYANQRNWVSDQPYESAEIDVDEGDTARTTLAALKGQDDE